MKPPNSLKRQGKRLWEDIVSGWEVQPEQSVLLQDLCESQDRITELSRTLREEGQITKDRYGQPKPHPAAVLLKAEVGIFATLYKALALEVPGGSDVLAGRPAGWQPDD